MAERTAHIYECLDARFELELLYAALTPLDLTLEHLQSSVVFQLSRYGDQLETTQQELEAEIEKGVDTSFQMWFEEDHDLYLRVKRMNRVRLIEFGMEGTTRRERESLREALLSYFATRVSEKKALGLIFDPEGVAEDIDWDSFFDGEAILSKSSFTSGVPDLLLLGDSLAQRLVGFQLYSIGDGVKRAE